MGAATSSASPPSLQSTISRRVRYWMLRNNRRLLVVGLDGAGKSTLVQQLGGAAFDKQDQIGGCAISAVEVGKLQFDVWDAGGEDRLRTYWRHYYTGSHAVAFVVDSADRARLAVAVEEFRGVVRDHQLAQTVILIIANKQDVAGAATVDEISTMFAVTELVQQHRVIGTSATASGEGLSKALEWLGEVCVPFAR